MPARQGRVPGQEAEDAHRDDPLAHAPEIQGSPTRTSDRSPHLPHTLLQLQCIQILPAFIFSTSVTGEYAHVSSREIAGVMDAICTLASTQATQHAAHDQRLARAEATLGQCHSMLHQIMTHLGLPHDPAPRQEPATDDDADSLDVLAAAGSSFTPITTTAVRWLGFFLDYVQFQLYQLPANTD